MGHGRIQEDLLARLEFALNLGDLVRFSTRTVCSVISGCLLDRLKKEVVSPRLVLVAVAVRLSCVVTDTRLSFQAGPFFSTSVSLIKISNLLSPADLETDGGFLQFGSPNTINPSALLSETDCKCIVVAPGYRLNAFGFLASRELQQDSTPDGAVGNYGFWDQRLALEWTHKNISYFGGDASNVTVAGYSAGMS